MSKRIISLVIFISLFCSTSFVLAQTVTITNPLNSNDFTSLLNNIITGIGGIVVALSTIMFIVAGVLYLTSAGSPEKINMAKKALTFAIIGIVIAVVAGSIAAIIKSTLGVT